MDELAQFFKELQNRYEMSLAQNKKLKKKNDFLKNKLEIVLNEKKDLSISFEKMKKDFDKYKLICKGKSPNITFNKNEFLDIQKYIDALDTTLKKCAFDTNYIYVSKEKNLKEIYISFISHAPRKTCTHAST